MTLCEILAQARAKVEDGTPLAALLDRAIAEAGCGGATTNDTGGGPNGDPDG